MCACVCAIARRREELRGVLSGREPKFSPAYPLPLPSSLSSRKMVDGIGRREGEEASACGREGGREEEGRESVCERVPVRVHVRARIDTNMDVFRIQHQE